MNPAEEKDALGQASAAGRVMSEYLDHTIKENGGLKKTNNRLWIALVSVIALFSIVCGCLLYTVCTAQAHVSRAIAESQEVFNQALIEALNTVADMEVEKEVVTTTTTTTQSAEGDSAVFNNVSGDLFTSDSQVFEGGK